MRHASAVRIDHVMGLHRLWWIPKGLSPEEGAYVRYRPSELRAILILEAVRAGVAVVGEDLGTVAGPVRAGMRRDMMLGCHVHQFTATPTDPLPVPPRTSVASFGTHDLPTFAAWWDGLDIKERAARGDLSKEDAEAAMARRRAIRIATTATSSGDGRIESMLAVVLLSLARGPAEMLLVDLEDLWLEKEPQNRPGTGEEEHNFSRRWAQLLPIASSAQEGAIAELLRAIDAARNGIEPPEPAREYQETAVIS
jgi:4-alpha-glucanotransferase